MKKKPQSEEIRTLLGEGAKFDGELSFQGTVRIDGVFSGKIFSESASLIIGENGQVEGDVAVTNIVVLGKFKGKCSVAGLTRLIAGSFFEGELKTVELTIEKTAKFNGQCTMSAKSPESHK
jgi:cytoskeletal protein CcmA (bactofilin family)